MPWEEYLSLYKVLVAKCLNDFVAKLKLKNEVIESSKVLLEGLISNLSPVDVYPKNRRKRLSEDPSRYPKNKFKFMQTIEDQYGKALSDKRLKTICEILDCLPSGKFKRSQATLLIYSKIDRDRTLVHTDPPLSLPNILIIAYIAMNFTYSETKPVTIGDVIEWAYTGILPYFTAYEGLNIDSRFKSLFKPLALPSAQWLRKAASTFPIDCVKSFRIYYLFMYNLSILLCEKLKLPQKIAEIAFKIYLRAMDDILTQKTDKVLPV